MYRFALFLDKLVKLSSAHLTLYCVASVLSGVVDVSGCRTDTIGYFIGLVERRESIEFQPGNGASKL